MAHWIRKVLRFVLTRAKGKTDVRQAIPRRRPCTLPGTDAQTRARSSSETSRPLVFASSFKYCDERHFLSFPLGLGSKQVSFLFFVSNAQEQYLNIALMQLLSLFSSLRNSPSLLTRSSRFRILPWAFSLHIRIFPQWATSNSVLKTSRWKAFASPPWLLLRPACLQSASSPPKCRHLLNSVCQSVCQRLYQESNLIFTRIYAAVRTSAPFHKWHNWSTEGLSNLLRSHSV